MSGKAKGSWGAVQADPRIRKCIRSIKERRLKPSKGIGSPAVGGGFFPVKLPGRD